MGDVIPFPSRLASSADVGDESAGRTERWHPSQGTPRFGFAPLPSRPGGQTVAPDVPAGEIPAPRPPLEPLWRELLGQQLREERHDQGLRLKDVAERAGVSPQYLSEVERGLKDPSSELLAAIAGALGLGILDLVSDVAKAPLAPSPTCSTPPHLTLVV